MDGTADLAVALAIGLLIGAERERRKGEGRGRAAAGIRTFALVGLAGGLARAVGGEAVLAAGLLCIGAVAVASYIKTAHEDPGLTTEVAIAVTFLLGALAFEEPATAAAFGVVTAVLLTAREWLHNLVRSVLTEQELHDLLIFGAAAVVVLPLLPDRDLGPYGAVNPVLVWRLVVLVLGVSSLGYVALRVLGARLGIPLAGLAGGFVSSAATIASMGGLASRQEPLLRAATAGAVLSTVATVIQMAAVLGAISTPVLRELALPLAAAGLAALGFGLVAALRTTSGDGDARSDPGRPFDLVQAMIFAGALSTLAVASAALNAWLGSAGVMAGAAVAGFADTHSAAAAVAGLVARGDLAPHQAVLPILAALTTNAVTKAVAAYASRKLAFARIVWLGLLCVMAAAWAGYAVAASV